MISSPQFSGPDHHAKTAYARKYDNVKEDEHARCNAERKNSHRYKDDCYRTCNKAVVPRSGGNTTQDNTQGEDPQDQSSKQPGIDHIC